MKLGLKDWGIMTDKKYGARGMGQDRLSVFLPQWQERDGGIGQGRILFGKGCPSPCGKACLIGVPQLSDTIS